MHHSRLKPHILLFGYSQPMKDISHFNPCTSQAVLLIIWIVLLGLGLLARAQIEVSADTLGLPISTHPLSRDYSKPSVQLDAGDQISFTIRVSQSGLYNLYFDAAALDAFLSAPEAELWLDGAPLEKAPQIVFPVFYSNTLDNFPRDRYGNETFIPQKQLLRWSHLPLHDANFNQAYPLQIYLSGQHYFKLTLTKQSLLLGSIYILPFKPYPSYSDYARDLNQPSGQASLELEAEYPSYKNNTAIRPGSSRSLGVSPYDTYRLLLNSLGGESWKSSGSTAYYRFEVPQDGLYAISLRVLQSFKNNATVFRRITLNDQVLFDELKAVGFAYNPNWYNLTLGGSTPYQIFLTKGVHVLGIEATASPYDQAIENIKKAMLDINALSLDIKKLTGNQADLRKEWVISDYIPDIKERLLAIADDLRADLELLKDLSIGGASQEVLTYQMAIDNIVFLAQDPDKLPIRMARFSQGSGSAAQMLGELLTSLQNQPLALDKLYIHPPHTIPDSSPVNLALSLSETTKRFFHSFRPDPYRSLSSRTDELEIWVNRQRQYVDLLQQMTDQGFSQDTGIRVKFSIMPDESKLVLAKAAGIEPDVALGVSTHIPYELAIRQALKDLRSFDDFDSFINIYSPGALLGYIIDDSVYALPETQDFWLTFYRKDILESLQIPVPDTWTEVLEILPELQRYGMNYNTLLSSEGGLKDYRFTAPYLLNNAAQLYSPDGFSTGLSTEEAISAVRFMAESFTLYGMPLTTSSFYESFRNGTLPIGISNFETYLKLSIAAPELRGLWDIALYPATELANGQAYRYTTGSAQASIMFASTDQPQAAWDFLKWWMSSETQVAFQQQLVLNYGLEYLWSSANLEALAYSPIPQKHREIILEQWTWLQEPVRLPGGYMQERELSNAWNKIVFDGLSPRVAVDEAVLIINREIRRKMEEFGYLKNGQKVKTFKVPTLETVRQWMREDLAHVEGN